MPATPEETAEQIQQWERYIEDLRQEADQVKSVQPTGYYAVNPRGVQQFKFHINKRAQSIHDDFMDAKQRLQKLYDQRDKAKVAAEKAAAAKEPKQMTEAQALKRQDIDEKQRQDTESETPQKKLAESRLEQQKAADAASVATLGATIFGPKGAQSQSMKDLLTKFTSRYDRETGEHVFSQPNDEGNLTADQKRKAKELEAAFKLSDVPPEAIFGPGVPAPSFNKEGNSVSGSGNPFIGTQQKYNALRQLYIDSQPRPNIELRVPSGAVDRAYQESAPAYGGALPGNPVEMARQQERARVYGVGAPGEEGYVPPSVPRQVEDALIRGKVDSDVANLQRPTGISMAPAAVPAPPGIDSDQPITLGTGGIVGAPTKDYGAFRNFGITPNVNATTAAPGPEVSPVPPPPPAFGPQPATPEERQQAGAVIAEQWKQRSPNAAAIIRQFRLKGIDENDPAVARALADDSYEASHKRSPGDFGTVAEVAGNLAGGGAPYLGKLVGDQLAEAPQTIMNAFRTWQGQQAREAAEKQRADDARRAAGLEIMEEAPPSV